jgi:hypothetical protein
MAKLLSTGEAFRAILRSAHPERVDLHHIDSNQWFLDRRGLIVGRDLIHDLADEPAYAAYDLLKADVKGQKIRLHGCLNGALAADIDPIDAREGKLDVFAAVLKIYESKDTFRTSRTYTSVHCYADDLPLPRDGADLQQQMPQMHYPGDAALIEEGIRKAANGMKYRPIARELAPRAEGSNTDLASKEDRLRKAIAAEHKRRLGDR